MTSNQQEHTKSAPPIPPGSGSGMHRSGGGGHKKHSHRRVFSAVEGSLAQQALLNGVSDTLAKPDFLSGSGGGMLMEFGGGAAHTANTGTAAGDLAGGRVGGGGLLRRRTYTSDDANKIGNKSNQITFMGNDEDSGSSPTSSAAAWNALATERGPVLLAQKGQQFEDDDYYDEDEDEDEDEDMDGVDGAAGDSSSPSFPS